jgi:hypothetical protein
MLISVFSLGSAVLSHTYSVILTEDGAMRANSRILGVMAVGLCLACVTPAALADRDARWGQHWDGHGYWGAGTRHDWRHDRRGDWRRDWRRDWRDVRHGRGILLPGGWQRHWYSGNRRIPQPYVAYRDRWGLGAAYTHGLVPVYPLVRDHRRSAVRAARNHRRPARITGCYPIDRLPGGRERRVELPISACR